MSNLRADVSTLPASIRNQFSDPLELEIVLEMYRRRYFSVKELEDHFADRVDEGRVGYLAHIQLPAMGLLKKDFTQEEGGHYYFVPPDVRVVVSVLKPEGIESFELQDTQWFAVAAMCGCNQEEFLAELLSQYSNIAGRRCVEELIERFS